MATKKSPEVTELQESEIFDVFEFARSITQTSYNALTPDLVNSRMKDINMNPLSATAAEIDKALLSPKSSESALIGISEFFEYTDMVYKRVLNYIALIPSFDLTYNCVNSIKSDYKKTSYKSDVKIVNEFLDRFDYKAEFKKAMKQMLRQETYYTSFRDDGRKYVLQELPTAYCKITGRSEWGFLFDFNMLWFIQPGVSIDMYSDVFKDYYNQVFDGSNHLYNPAAGISSRDGSYVYYVQTSPEDGAWAFKFSPELAGNVPFLSPMFSDLVLAPMMRKLQTNKYIIEASKLIIGLVPLLKDNNSVNMKDKMAISPETLGKFLGLLKMSISDVFSVGAVPFSDVKPIDFNTNNTNIQENYNKNLSSSSGINSRLIYGLDKPNAMETLASINVDEMLSTYIYPYFENFLEYNINRLTGKYKFKFKFEGTEFTQNRKDRLDYQMKLSEKGIVLPKKIAAAIGMNYADFERQLEEAREDGWVDKLTPIINGSQMSGKENGRPEKSIGEVSDSGMNTKENASNIAKV